MSDPTPGTPAGLSALSDPDNVGWVQDTELLTEEQAYWRLRGMVPPPQVPLEE